jgi:RimJ/RimL family protein N-acetyltransferase
VSRVNEFGQPIGEDLDGWEPPTFPPAEEITGRLVRLEPLHVAHARGLRESFAAAPDSLWTYLFVDPLRETGQWESWIATANAIGDWQPYAAVVDGTPTGFLTYLRVDAGNGTIEIGSIGFSPVLQRTTAATEVLFLMIDHAFHLGYRRCEWKCDALNAPSRRAATRLGFEYEGTFRQATHYKGRNRDTAWYSITDSEWPALRASLVEFLDARNIDARGDS